MQQPSIKVPQLRQSVLQPRFDERLGQIRDSSILAELHVHENDLF